MLVAPAALKINDGSQDKVVFNIEDNSARSVGFYDKNEKVCQYKTLSRWQRT